MRRNCFARVRVLFVSVAAALSFHAMAWAASLRIVSLSPGSTEVVAAVGLEASLVGVSEQCDFPPSVAKLPKVGGLMNPSLEAILALRPDVVLASEGNPRDLLDRLAKAKVRVVEARAETAPDLPPMIRRVGKEIGAEAKALEVSATLEARLERLRKHGASLKRHPTFLIALQLDPLFSVTSETWLGGLVELAGWRNAVPKGKVRYPQLASEFLVAAKPDFVLADPEVAGKNAAKALEDVTAYLARVFGRKDRLPRVVVFPPDVLVRPGPRLSEGIDFLMSLPQ